MNQSLKQRSESIQSDIITILDGLPEGLIDAVCNAVVVGMVANPEKYRNAVKNRDEWRAKAKAGKHPGKGFCMEQADLHESIRLNLLEE